MAIFLEKSFVDLALRNVNHNAVEDIVAVKMYATGDVIENSVISSAVKECIV